MKITSEILVSLFRYLDSVEAKYCVMNNYENLPYVIISDVDIVLEKKFYNSLDSIVSQIAEENSVVITQKIWHGYNKCAYILSPLVIDTSFRVQLDFFTDFSAKGYPGLLKSEIILGTRKRFSSFFIPDPAIEAIFIFMRRIIKNDMCKAHADKLKVLLMQNKTKIGEILRGVFGEELGALALYIIQSGDIKLFSVNFEEYRRFLKKWSNRNISLFYQIKYGLGQLKRVVSRLSHPVGFCVVLLGPDGCGKSTVARLVLERVSGSFHGGEIKYWRPHLLPPMGKLKVWNPSEEPKANPRPHDHPKQNLAKSLLRFFYYLLDYLIGYFPKVYVAKVKKRLIIFDRYYYDYLVDLKRYQFNIPNWLPGIFLPLIPSPDLTIYLDVDPTDLLNRKQELSISELGNQVQTFQKIVLKLPNAYVVKASRHIEDVVREISYLLLNLKSLQTKKTLKNAN